MSEATPHAKAKAARAEKSTVLIRRLLREHLKPYWSRVVIAALFMGLAALMTGALARLMEPVIDEVFQSRSAEALWPVALMVFGAFAVRGIATYFHSVMMNDVGQRLVADVQNRLYSHLSNADLSFFHGHPAGSLISRMTADISVMRNAVAECFTGVVKSNATLIVLVAVMFHQDWRLALAAFVVFPLAMIYVLRLGKRMRRVGGATQAELGRFSSLLNENFQGIRLVKAYGMETYEQGRIATLVDRLRHLVHKQFRLSALTGPVNEILSGVAIVTVIVYGGARVIAGESTTGAFFSFITAFLLAYEPIKRIGKLNAILQAGLASAERVFALLDMKPSIADSADARVLKITGPTIRFENVTFFYGEGANALQQVTIEVPAGKTVALVGPSGAGKSTLLNLIPRFYDVSEGRLTIDGQDVRDVTLASLRANIALVSQDVTVFDDTLAANIAYGKAGASRAEIVAAAKAAAADGFITSLPEGYETIVGEQGVRLSGGQRQRIAIARAMLRNAPILLLDEATSALDADSERAVQQALRELRQGRTTLVIAHRLSTIVEANLIYVLDQGRVIEQGRHHDLLAMGGVYARLYGAMGEAEKTA